MSIEIKVILYMFNHKHPEPIGEPAEPWRRVRVAKRLQGDFGWFGGSAGSPTAPTAQIGMFLILSFG